jgi:hypothetical protein
MALIPNLIRQHAPDLVSKAIKKPRLDPQTGEEQPTPLSHKIAQGLMLRVATKSVPGAILVGGYLLAKHLSERRKAKAAEKE